MEDSAAFCGELQSLIHDVPGAKVTGTAATLPDAIRLLDRDPPDVLFLDLFLGQGTGLEVLDYLASRRSSVQTAMMTSSPSDQLKDFSLSRGARWFVDKAEIIDAIPQVCEQARSR